MTFKEYIEREKISNTIISLFCSYKGLTDLEGIESFKKLTYLDCSFNNLTDLKDIENLTDLIYLSCSNKITSLKEIDQLKQLEYLISDITNDIKEARQLIKTEIRIDKISDIYE